MSREEWKTKRRYVGTRRLERLLKAGVRRDGNAEAAQLLSGRGSRALDQPLPSALTDSQNHRRWCKPFLYFAPLDIPAAAIGPPPV